MDVVTREPLRFLAKQLPCPHCQRPALRHSTCRQMVRDIRAFQPVIYSKHRCTYCNKHFSHYEKNTVVPPRGHYSKRLIASAVALWTDHTLCEIVEILKHTTGHRIPQTTVHDWFRGQGKEHRRRTRAERLAPLQIPGEDTSQNDSIIS